jgi:hypothetical protein
MRRRLKSHASRGSGLGTQNLIILLLVVLIILTSADLYLDHFARRDIPTVQKQPSTQTQANRTAALQQPARDTVKVAPASTVTPAVQKPAPAPLLTDDMPAPRDIQIQILNGCGTPGIASKIRGVLRQRGFDVMTYGNAQTQDNSKTRVIARTGNNSSLLAAQRLANSLGISADQVSVDPDPNMVDIDVTLLLGADHSKLDLR